MRARWTRGYPSTPVPRCCTTLARMPTAGSSELILVVAACLLAGCAARRPVAPAQLPTPVTTATLLATPSAQVFAVERAFAKTMADRDFKAFIGYLSSE